MLNNANPVEHKKATKKAKTLKVIVSNKKINSSGRPPKMGIAKNKMSKWANLAASSFQKRTIHLLANIKTL